jgi:hypothetical protein
MSPAKEPSSEPDQTEQKLSVEVRNAEKLYRSTTEQYLNVTNEFQATADDLQGEQAVYDAAKEMRMARKRYRRASKVLEGFTTST